MTYVVCQTGSCSQTYPLDSLGVITKDTKNIACEKCGGVLVDENGRANFSQNPYIIKTATTEEVEKMEQEEILETEEDIKRLEKELEAKKQYLKSLKDWE